MLINANGRFGIEGSTNLKRGRLPLSLYILGH